MTTLPLLHAAARLLSTWASQAREARRVRRELRELSEMSDSELRDLGLSHASAAAWSGARQLQRRSLVLGAFLLGASGLHAADAPRDYATERVSERGAFRVSYRSEASPLPIRKLHAWTLHVARADGSPVTDAAIAVDGDMPEHRHGLATQPRVTANLGKGDYLVEGIKFQMGGWWVMDFDVTAGGQKDRVRFNLQLK